MKRYPHYQITLFTYIQDYAGTALSRSVSRTGYCHVSIPHGLIVPDGFFFGYTLVSDASHMVHFQNKGEALKPIDHM